MASAADILDDLNILLPEDSGGVAHAAARSGALKPDEKLVYDAIGENETPIDAIISKTSLPSGRVSSTLLLLEMKHMVKQLPGQHFIKLG